MNYRLVCRLLGFVAWLIGATMLFSLPWAWPAMGGQAEFEWSGFLALVGSTAVCLVVGWVLRLVGREVEAAVLYRKEAMAVVGLSWVLATILGALPYYSARTSLGRVNGPGSAPVHMSLADCIFESESGFTTTGATVLTDVEDPELVPRCILFWRSSTHFLGGLGIIVLFVAVLGHGSAGKVLMRAEMPGPSKEGSHERMQHTAWNFAVIYVALNVLLAILLKLQGRFTPEGTMTWFDAVCHAFGTIATGGFSTYNNSVAHFDSVTIDYTLIVFMILSGTNFALIYLCCIGKPIRLLRDMEWQAYIGWIILVTAIVTLVGTLRYNDFNPEGDLTYTEELLAALRYGMFNIISIMTTTGFATHDFDRWNQLARSVLFLSMFVGACAGSTSGGIKMIRHVLFVKILFLEVEHSYRPSVIRHVRLGGESLTDPEIRKNIMVYFGLVFFIFMLSWLTIVAIEDDATWTARNMPLDNKLIDVASGVISCFSNIGPGLGTVGATQNYAAFNWRAKLVLSFVMILGRLEVYPVVVLFLPAFWRSR